MAEGLPEFVEPMLARLGQPFDSEQHIFEIKWDGFRGLIFAEGDRSRLLSRNRQDLLARFPEHGWISELEPGLLLDGEIVAFRDGKPDFQVLLGHDDGEPRQATTYVAFDVLYRGHVSRMTRPLSDRREELREVVESANLPRLVCSDGIAGNGKAFFGSVTEQGLEGVVAKRLDSPYLPGKRTDLWTKIKARQTMHCAIIGFVPDGEREIKSVILATNDPDGLTCVGKVGSGLGNQRRAELNSLLRERVRETPLVPTTERGLWVEPGLYCTVSYVERTRDGNLRAPVFGELIRE